MTVAEVALSSLPITICDISHEIPATYISCDFTYGLNKIKCDMLKETTFMRWKNTFTPRSCHSKVSHKIDVLKK